MNSFSKLTLCGAALALVACSSTMDASKVDYKSAVKAPVLSVPPDLTQLSQNTRYNVIDGAVSASDYKADQEDAAAAAVAAAAIGDVRLERIGNQRWLVVNRTPEALWDSVKQFWIENGFVLAKEQSNLGIMETDWAENRAKIPQDFIRGALGKLLDALYSTSERDRFRTRLERNANGSTEIYISHRGMEEVYTSNSKEQTVWQPRRADPELEAEFLQRLMVKLGVPQDRVKTLMTSSEANRPIASVSTSNGQSSLRIEEGFERAWRRVGQTLDRTNFTIENRDRKQGVYFVRYVPPNADNSEPGFFSKLFGNTPADSMAMNLRIALVSTSDALTIVSVLNADGQPANADTATRIVNVLVDSMQ